MTHGDSWSRNLSSVLGGGTASLPLILPVAVSRSRLGLLIPLCPLPAVLGTLATCLPAHQVQDTGGNSSTFQRADWRVNERSAPQTCHSPGRPGCRHASDFPERRLPLATGGLRKPRCSHLAWCDSQLQACDEHLAPSPTRTFSPSPVKPPACSSLRGPFLLLSSPVWRLSRLMGGSTRAGAMAAIVTAVPGS